MTWTEERIADLMRMWTAGHTVSCIGNALGVSKNTVIGKAHRLKLPSRPSPIRLSTSPRKPKPPMAKQVIKIKPKPILRAAQPRNGAPACLWPIGDPGEAHFHFCGAETVPGKPYCPCLSSRPHIRPARRDSAVARHRASQR